MNEQLLYHIALTSIPNIGDVTAKKLIAYCGSSEQVFKESKRLLEKVPGIGSVYAKSIIDHKTEALNIAEEELEYIQENDIIPLFYLNDNYPKRLVHCEDGPILLYTKGNIDFNNQKVVSIVGTRRATDYGKEFCEKIVADLAPHNPLIISGLAYGIDVAAHKAAIKNKLSTVGVLAHGLDRLYPAQHKGVAKEMLEKGGLASDFKSGTNPDRENFPKRNRVVAGLSDLTIVVESSKKGGSLITAGLANGYNRDVFALPGKLSDTQSEGCNWLIKTNKAALIQSVKDIEYIMNWKVEEKPQNKQASLFVELTPEQQVLRNLLSQKEKMAIDEISLVAKMPMSQTTTLLLEMEFSGLVKSLPGKMYKLV
ncbi:MAG: DNA-processing protein DprA [Vicingaceae bacterium]|nr:DNA-processing protein DprA [Vicingaceae bacterium]